MSMTALTRRRLLQSSAAGAAGLTIAGASLPRPAAAADKVLKIGFLAPLTGEVAAWGLPGLNGCNIWADEVNAAGGIEIGGDTYTVEFVPYDNEYSPDRALAGARKLVLEDEVKFIMMLGGDTWPAVQPFANANGMLVSTLLPSDLSPDTPSLIAPTEVHPIYNVTGVQWLAENFPDAKRVAICAQEDSLGRPSVATYQAAFKVHGMEMVDEIFFDPATTDFAPIMTRMLASNPDVLCLDTAYADFVNLLMEQAFLQGFGGKIISCTFDNYPQVIEKTSVEFVEGTIFQFPDFDDPALEGRVTFTDSQKFWNTYQERFPNTWSAVSWEYASIMSLWVDAAKAAGSVEPGPVLQAMKASPTGQHAFGPAVWWGEELFGINNALVGDWPVVVMNSEGRARIAEFKSIPAWWDAHKETFIETYRAYGEMWDQRA